MAFRNTLLAAAMVAFATPALAIPIDATFNFVLNGTLNANTGDITSASFITLNGSPSTVTTVISTNIGLTSGMTILLTNPTPLTLGSTFQKIFTTNLGTFTEDLAVTLVTVGANSVGITATGTISGGVGFDVTPVFYSAAYTQNGGPGTQINASFNDSTIPPPSRVPEPASLALLGVGLMGLAASRRLKK